jgi:hypothetical protein
MEVFFENLEKDPPRTMRGPGGQPMSPEEHQKRLAQFKKGPPPSKGERIGNIVGHVLGILGALSGHGHS